MDVIDRNGRGTDCIPPDPITMSLMAESTMKRIAMVCPAYPQRKTSSRLKSRRPSRFGSGSTPLGRGGGFNSHSEFIRHVLHDTVENPTFDRDEQLAIALGERDSREGRTHTREDIMEGFHLDDEAG